MQVLHTEGKGTKTLKQLANLNPYNNMFNRYYSTEDKWDTGSGAERGKLIMENILPAWEQTLSFYTKPIFKRGWSRVKVPSNSGKFPSL